MNTVLKEIDLTKVKLISIIIYFIIISIRTKTKWLHVAKFHLVDKINAGFGRMAAFMSLRPNFEKVIASLKCLSPQLGLIISLICKALIFAL